MKKIILFILLITSMVNAQTSCNQSSFSTTYSYSPGTTTIKTCCSLETLFLCSGTSSSNPTTVVDTVMRGRAGNVFLNSNAVYWYKPESNGVVMTYDTIIMKTNSTLYLVGNTGSASTIIVVMEPNATVINNSVHNITTYTCSLISHPVVANCNTSVTDLISNTSRVGELLIYPNPAKNLLHVTVKNTINLESVTLFNQLGQKVYENTTVSDKHIAIPISHLPNGVYFIKTGSNLSQKTKKVCIEN